MSTQQGCLRFTRFTTGAIAEPGNEIRKSGRMGRRYPVLSRSRYAVRWATDLQRMRGRIAGMCRNLWIGFWVCGRRTVHKSGIHWGALQNPVCQGIAGGGVGTIK